MASGGLSKIGDGPWPVGAVQAGEVETIPAGGVARLYDGLYSEDGSVYRRGGSVYLSNASFGSGGLQWVLSSQLGGGYHTAFATSASFGSLNADGVTPAARTTVDALTPQLSSFPALFHGMLVLPIVNNSSAMALWAGSRKAFSYATGTISGAAGSTTIAGAGTSWVANADAGMILLPTVTGAPFIPVASVTSNTQLELAEPLPVAVPGASAYRLYPAVSGSLLNYTSASAPSIVTVAGDRVLSVFGNILVVSPAWPTAFSGTVGGADDFHTFATPIVGVAPFGTGVLVFTQDGTYTVTNLALDLTDALGNPQRRQEKINDMILWGSGGAGLARWNNQIIVPAMDGIWLLDSISGPTLLSVNFQDQYLAQLEGYKPGKAVVYDGHYYLPVQDTSGNPVDLYVCKLAGARWSQMRGHGGGGTVRAVDVQEPHDSLTGVRLIGAGSDGRVLTLAHDLPGTSVKSDADGTNHVLELQSRAFTLGGNVAHQCRFVKAHYSLTDAASDNPTVDLAYAVDGTSTFTAATGTAAETSGTLGEYTWRVEKQARTIQLRLRTSGATSAASFRNLELQVSQSGRQ